MKNSDSRKFFKLLSTVLILLVIFLAGCSDPDYIESSTDLSDAGIILWTGEGFTGESKFIKYNSSNLNSLPDGLSANLSSIELKGGSSAILFTEENQTGDCIYVTESMDDLGEYNNAVKSMAVFLPKSALSKSNAEESTKYWVSIVSMDKDLPDLTSMAYVSHERRRNKFLDWNLEDLIVSNREDLRDWEKFELEFYDGSSEYFTLKTAEGTYVSADWKLGGWQHAVLIGNRDSAPTFDGNVGWEGFKMVETRTGDNFRIGNIYSVSTVYGAKVEIVTAFDHVMHQDPNAIEVWDVPMGTDWSRNLYRTFMIFEHEAQEDKPLIVAPFTADPSAHVFPGDDKIYIYTSIDTDHLTPSSDPNLEDGDFNMREYRVFSMDDSLSSVEHYDSRDMFDVYDIAWARHELDGVTGLRPQLWAPDAAKIGNAYYHFFPAKSKEFTGAGETKWRIGAARSNSPTGPFTVDPNPIQGYGLGGTVQSSSIDPAVINIETGPYQGAYMYFGGIWGGQLEKITYGTSIDGTITSMGFDNSIGFQYPWPTGADDAIAKSPFVARLGIVGDYPRIQEMKVGTIVDENNNEFVAGDVAENFFEGPWMNKIGDKFYLSYSTGVFYREMRGYIGLAVGDTPWGTWNPDYVDENGVKVGRYEFMFKGWVMVDAANQKGGSFTNHHSIVEFPENSDNWYLFYHNAEVGLNGYRRSITYRQLDNDWYTNPITTIP